MRGSEAVDGKLLARICVAILFVVVGMVRAVRVQVLVTGVVGVERIEAFVVLQEPAVPPILVGCGRRQLIFLANERVSIKTGGCMLRLSVVSGVGCSIFIDRVLSRPLLFVCGDRVVLATVVASLVPLTMVFRWS